MLQSGVDLNTIRSYVLNSQSPFNLDADQVIYLKDEGAPTDLINAMMNRDKTLAAAVPAQPAPAPEVAGGPDAAPPTPEVTVNQFYDTLSPYGAWVNVEGYGRCWRPTVVVYNPSWSPYCDSGHWVYTDYGWYWDSDYAWGIAFHYGRWFRNPQFGWCWYPDTVWAPSWVAWRSGGDYCGWAPLPPFAVFRPGIGFYYRGVSVGMDFDFGLSADCFVFVDAGHFCDRHPRSFCVPHERVTQVYHQTTIINNYNVVNNTVVNRGFGTERITSVTHRELQPVHVSSLPHAAREGWHGAGAERPLGSSTVNYNSTAGHNTTIRNDRPAVTTGATTHPQTVEPGHPQTVEPRTFKTEPSQPQTVEPRTFGTEPGRSQTVESPLFKTVPGHSGATDVQHGGTTLQQHQTVTGGSQRPLPRTEPSQGQTPPHNTGNNQNNGPNGGGNGNGNR
jgi:hypothetical protein